MDTRERVRAARADAREHERAARVDAREHERAAARAGVGARVTACTRASSSARDDAHRRAETDASVGARTNDARTGDATVHMAQPFPSAIREAPPEDA